MSLNSRLILYKLLNDQITLFDFRTLGGNSDNMFEGNILD